MLEHFLKLKVPLGGIAGNLGGCLVISEVLDVEVVVVDLLGLSLE